MAKTDFIKQDVNQFAMTSVRGLVDHLGDGSNVISAIVSGDETIYSGDAVEIVATSKGLVEVKGLTEDGKIFGFVRFNPKKVKYVAGDRVEIAIDGSIMVMAASDAINAGANVTYDQATGLIEAASSGDAVCGIAIEKMAANTTGRVIIKAL